MREIWKPIAKYNGDYEVSSLGRVRSLKFAGGKILKPTTLENGYVVYCLSLAGKTKVERVHRLVAQAFIYNENPSERKVVRHINGDLSDNRVDNLEWACRLKKEDYPAIGQNPGYMRLLRYENALRGRQPSSFSAREVSAIKHYWKQGWPVESLVLFFGGTYPEVLRIATNVDYREIEPAAW